MKIVLLTHSVNPRGGVVHTLELAQALHEAGHTVTVMAPALPGQQLFRPIACRFEPVPVACTPANVLEMVVSRIDAYEAHLTAMLTRERFDVLHAQDAIGANALANLQQRGLVDGFVRTVHHLDTFDDARVMAWQQRGVESARLVLCVSRHWCEVLRRAHGIDAALVYNGVDCTRYSRRRDASDAVVAQRFGLRGGAGAGPVLLAVGGIEARKNTLRILQAFLALRDVAPHAQLVIAGGASLLNHDAYAAEFHAMVAASGIATGRGEALMLTGTVPDELMPALFRAADALVMPSLREGFGLVVLEALASGTPAVVSAIAPFTEHLGDAEVCWADPTDVASITRAMLAACEPSRRHALAAETPAVCRRFDWRASAERHIALYRAGLSAAHAQALELSA